jgi:hypothetical protein
MSPTEDHPEPPLSQPVSSPLAALPDLLLRPLGEDVEMRHIFRGDIEERLRHTEVRGGELSQNEAAAWLAARPGVVPSRKPWLLTLLALAALLTLFGVAWEGYNLLPFFATAPGGPPMFRELGEKQLYRIPARRADNPLLDTSFNPTGAAEACWRGHPEDPVLYYYYVSTLIFAGRPLPEDYDATWRSIDPDNAFWLLLQARSALTPPAVATATPGPASEPPPPPEAPPEVVAMLVEASQLPGCHSYDADAMKFLKEQSHEPVTFPQATGLRMSSFQPMLLPRETMADWQSLSREASEHEGELSDGDEHGYETVATWLDQIREEATNADSIAVTMSDFHYMENTVPAAMTMGLRIQTIASAGFFLVLAGVLILRQFPARGPAGRMALCARPLLDPRGSRWLALKYVAVPMILLAGLAGVVFFKRVTDDDRMAYLMVLPPTIMLAALALMVGGARREVSRRTAFLGLRSSGFQRKLGWLLLLLALAPTVVVLIALAVGHNASNDQEAALTMIGGGCYGVTLLWLGLKWLLGFVSPTANVRHRLIAARLVPVMLIAALSLNLFALCLHPVEHYLMKKAASQPRRDWRSMLMK